MRLDLGRRDYLTEGAGMAKQQTTRRQKDISRLLREQKNIRKPKPVRPVKKKDGARPPLPP